MFPILVFSVYFLRLASGWGQHNISFLGPIVRHRLTGYVDFGFVRSQFVPDVFLAQNLNWIQSPVLQTRKGLIMIHYIIDLQRLTYIPNWVLKAPFRYERHPSYDWSNQTLTWNLGTNWLSAIKPKRCVLRLQSQITFTEQLSKNTMIYMHSGGFSCDVISSQFLQVIILVTAMLVSSCMEQYWKIQQNVPLLFILFIPQYQITTKWQEY